MRNIFKLRKELSIKNHQKGFTLPELLIVMTVIAGLASIMIVSYPATQRRARDTRRKNDIKQYQTSMEIYYNKSNKYPTASGNLVNVCGTLGLTSCPDDPKSTQHYLVSSSATSYLLWVQLEQPPSTTTYFYSCSTGKSGETTTNPSSTNPC